MAQITGVASWFWRLLFVLLATVAGAGALLYLLAWLLLPEADAPAASSQRSKPG